MLPDGSEKSQLTSAWAIVFFGTIRGWYLGVRVYVLGRESPQFLCYQTFNEISTQEKAYNLITCPLHVVLEIKDHFESTAYCNAHGRSSFWLVSNVSAICAIKPGTFPLFSTWQPGLDFDGKMGRRYQTKVSFKSIRFFKSLTLFVIWEFY